MSLNDIQSSRNPKVLNLTAVVGESTLDIAAQSKSGRLPVSNVKLRSQGTMKFGFVTGGPYYNLIANEVVDIGSFASGDPKTLFYIRVGGADVLFDVIIWN